MIRLNFICEFESDIVLHSSSNTEGKIDRFNYIAGSNFLGMVAREYDSFDNPFEVFHSGAVRFGDGHIIHNGKTTFSVPYSWFAPKDKSLKDAKEDNKIYNEYFLTKEDYNKSIKNNEQLKQQRDIFITLDGEVAQIRHNYRQKSVYDTKKRASKEGGMFGYYSLPKGTQWSFYVELDNPQYKDRIIEILENSKKLGKSKSAEYGRVKITFIGEKEKSFYQENLIEIDGKYYIFLYAYSRLALTNSGINSYKFDLESLKLDKYDGVKIAWDKSHIRTYRYTPYNFKRDNRDFERLVLNKGSVIAIEVDEYFDIKKYNEEIKSGIGLYLSEGHGKVVVNPKFLTTKQPTFDDSAESIYNQNRDNKYQEDNEITTWLKAEKEREEREYKLLKEVKEFIKKHNVKNKKSQWGQIRSLTMASPNSRQLYDALFSEDIVNNHPRGFLLHGRAKDKWDKALIDELRDKYDEMKDDYHSFIKLLSIYAPKEDDKGDDNEHL